tara:strand:- start:2209 stop:2472 length:264 start_codon:yes stop_codon:yes gene_type:complete
MLKEIKYFFYFLVIALFIFFLINFYISDKNKKKTYRNLNSIDKKISVYKSNLKIIPSDTDNIVNYLNNDDSSNKKKYSFWNLLKNEN